MHLGLMGIITMVNTSMPGIIPMPYVRIPTLAAIVLKGVWYAVDLDTAVIP
jgi:hypothetical protein